MAAPPPLPPATASAPMERLNVWQASSNPTGCYRASEYDRLLTRVVPAINGTSTGSWQAVRTAHAYTHGRVTIDFNIVHASNLMIGCVPSSFNAWNTYNIGARLVCDCDWRIDLGNTAGCGLSYRCNGNLRAVNDGSRTTGHATFAAGALVRMILDFDAQHVELLVNGASQGCHKFIAAGLANSPLYPAVSTHDDGEAVRLTAPEPLPPLLPPMLPQSSFAHPSPSTSQPLPSPVAAHPSAAVPSVSSSQFPSPSPSPPPVSMNHHGLYNGQYNNNNHNNNNGMVLPLPPPPLLSLLPNNGVAALPLPISSSLPVSAAYPLPLPETPDERQSLAILTSIGFGNVSGYGHLLLLRAFKGNLQHVVDHLVRTNSYPYH